MEGQGRMGKSRCRKWQGLKAHEEVCGHAPKWKAVVGRLLPAKKLCLAVSKPSGVEGAGMQKDWSAVMN